MLGIPRLRAIKWYMISAYSKNLIFLQHFKNGLNLTKIAHRNGLNLTKIAHRNGLNLTKIALIESRIRNIFLIFKMNSILH